MGKKASLQHGRRGRDEPAHPVAAAPSPGDRPAGGMRDTLLQALGGLVAAPVIGLFSGFLLLFAGLFLAIAWTIGPKPLIDAFQYAPYRAQATGRIVESWAALEFDPSELPAGKLRWQPYAKISSCAIVEYAGDWGAQRRGFCGNRFNFSDSFRIYDWNTMTPEVPFAFRRDASGFSVGEVRMSRTALDWLSAHAPQSTFMLGKPPPTTALAALRHQFDSPLETAIASWSTPFPTFPLAFDPQHPEAALPAKLVEVRRSALTPVAWFFVLILTVPGIYVLRIGMNLLTGQEGPLLWALTILPLLALPWWGDVLPRLVRQANADWADLATGMLDDIARVTRFSAGEPGDALLAGGERIEWQATKGEYADTFGSIAFALPQPPPKTADEALAALRVQTRAAVLALDGAAQKALFGRLREQYETEHRDVQTLFLAAAEDVLRDPNRDAAARLAARNFLLYGTSVTYYEDQLDRMEGK